MLRTIADKSTAVFTIAVLGLELLAVISGKAADTVTVVQGEEQLSASLDSATVPTKEALLSAQTRIYFVPVDVKVFEL